MEQKFVKTHFIEMNLNDVIDQLGEDVTKTILSSFSCPLNKDIENFIKYKAIEFSKRTTAKTHLVFWQTDDEKYMEFVGYYTLIDGADLLHLAVNKIRKIQKEIGGRFMYLECEDKEKLLDFYTKHNFKIFGKRTLDKDETDVNGEYLIQLFAMF